MNITIASLAEKVVVTLMAKPISDGVVIILKKSPEEKVAKALERALNQVSVDNEFWKNDVKIQIADVIEILIRTLDDPQYLDNNALPNYLNEKTIESFKECLKNDPEAWDYIQKVHYKEILQDIRTDVRKTIVIAQDINIVSHDINDRVRRIEKKLIIGNITAHFLTDIPSKADSTNVIGREGDLSKLWKTLQEKHHILLTGFGGIGKTKLAQMMFHAYESQFDEVAWIEYQGDLKRSFLGSITAKELQFEGNEDDRWRAMKSILTNDEKKKLFIIDNVDHDASQQPELDAELKDVTGWKGVTILLTTRMDDLICYESFNLNALELENCVKLFKKYCNIAPKNPQTIINIIELAHRHTLTIELLAKGAKRLVLEDYYSMLVEKGFQALDRTIVVDHDQENATIEHHLRILFNMQSRSDLDRKILYSFAILPVNCECKIEEIEQWFGFKNTHLDHVIQDGWLSYDEKSGTFSMHPLVRTIVRFDFTEDTEKKKNIAPIGTVDRILEYYASQKKLFYIDNDNRYDSLQRKINIAESVVNSVAQKENMYIETLYHNIGFSYYEMGDYGKALEYLIKALVINEKVLGPENSKAAASYSVLGSVYKEQGNYQMALACHSKALNIKEKIYGTSNTNTAISYNNIAMVYSDQGDYSKALKYYLKAVAINEKIFDPNHPDTATFYTNTGLAYFDLGEYDTALKYQLKAIAIDEKIHGTEHPSTATSYNNIGMTYLRLGNYKDALEYFFKALKIRENILGTEHPDTASSYNNIGAVYNSQSNYDEALKYQFKDLAICKKVFGIEHPNIAQSFSNIGATYYYKGEYDKALKYNIKALAINEKILGKKHPETARLYNNIGMIYYYEKKYHEALDYLKKAYVIYENVYGSRHHQTEKVAEAIQLVELFIDE